MSTETMSAPETQKQNSSAGNTGLRPTLNGIPENVRAEMVELLNQLLADTTDLSTQVKQAHWNVRGIHFQLFHDLFDEVYEGLPEFTDDLAERIGALGGVSLGTTRAAAEATRLPEIEHSLLEGDSAARAVAKRLAQVANATRAGIDRASEAGDEITADLLTEITRQLDKQLWFVESHLKA